MKALVYKGKQQIVFEERPKPEILYATDALVRVLNTTICGTDTGIYKGKNPDVESGRILGHEGIGIIEEIGGHVSNFKVGDKVLISCITVCRSCEYCEKELYAHCKDGGWILGNKIDGVQAEYVRIPHANNSLYHIPAGINDDVAVLLSDILPTGHEIGVQYGQVKPGDVIAIVGAGPVGMAILLTAQLYSPARIIMIDLDDNRLAIAKQIGATDIINSNNSNVVELIHQWYPDGIDVAIEAVGLPSTWDICQHIVKPGGNIANVGVHGEKVDFAIEKLWIKNLTITTGLVNTNTTAMLLETAAAQKFDLEKLITHRFHLSDIEQAYQVFIHASAEKALKILIENDLSPRPNEAV